MKKIGIIENSQGLGRYFTRFMDPDEYEIFPVWNTSQLPWEKFDNFDPCNAYIFTGDYNNISDGLLPVHRKEIEFVKTIRGKRIFASCFFHQLLGLVFGGAVGRRETRFLGWHRTAVEREHPILDGLKEPYFLNLNVDEITVRPENAIVLATNPDCRYQILRYGENIVTCQSHPEIFRDEAMELIEEHRKGLMNGCPDPDSFVSRTRKYADDEACRIFMTNLTGWLLSQTGE